MNSKINATIITALMTIGLCFVLEAEEKKEEANDFSVRFSLGIAPGIDEAENVDVNDDDGSRLEILAVKRFWDANNPTIGWTLGGGIFFSRHSLSDSDFEFDEVDITTFGVMAQGGVVADMGNGFTLELGPYLGAGTANNETTGFSDGTGPFVLYGIKGSAFILLSENIEVGVDLGYEGFSHEQEYDSGFGTVDFTYEGSGARVALVFGVTF